MKAVATYLRQSLNELTLVTWPKQEELVRMTILTVILVLVTAIFLGVIDYGFYNAYQWVISQGAPAA